MTFFNVNYRKPTLEVCAEGKLVSTMPYEEEEKAIALITVNYRKLNVNYRKLSVSAAMNNSW